MNSTITEIPDAIEVWLNQIHAGPAAGGARPPFDEWVWSTRDRQYLRVKDMPRSHIQNSLNWCIRRQAAGWKSKDGFDYTEWITAFTVKLFDPTVE